MTIKLDGKNTEFTVAEMIGKNSHIDKNRLLEDGKDILTEANNLFEAEHPDRGIGLIYGRVQSGKTNAMIISSALAMDNGYRVIIILTSDNVRLVKQTEDRFRKVLESNVLVYTHTKLADSIESVKSYLEDGEKRLLIVAPKSTTGLQSIITSIDAIGLTNEKAIIFDDEGDNASLDNNRNKRSKKGGGESNVKPTKVNELIFDKLRGKLDHVFISVTATPQGLILEGHNNTIEFYYLLEPGKGYIGGKEFFDPGNSYLERFDPQEVAKMIRNKTIEIGLEKAVCFYIVATAIADISNSVDKRKLQFLCHPSHKIGDQKIIGEIIKKYNLKLWEHINEKSDIEQTAYPHIVDYFNQLTKEVGIEVTFADFVVYLKDNLPNADVFYVNYKDKETLAFNHAFNYLIGGNTLGRGLTIDNLIVTYYGRKSKISNMDTMYQHARMFGYREPLLPFTKVFMSTELAERFYHIYEVDESIRYSIANLKKGEKLAIIIDSGKGVAPTRTGVIDADFGNMIAGGSQLYPNHINDQKHKSNSSKYEEMKSVLDGIINGQDISAGILVNEEAIYSLIEMIETSSTNAWKDKEIVSRIKHVNERMGKNQIKLKATTAETRTYQNGSIASGVISGKQDKEAKEDEYISVFMSDFLYKDNKELGNMLYPTVVIPKAFQGILVFQAKSE